MSYLFISLILTAEKLMSRLELGREVTVHGLSTASKEAAWPGTASVHNPFQENSHNYPGSVLDYLRHDFTLAEIHISFIIIEFILIYNRS